jgi:hypothetical protein
MEAPANRPKSTKFQRCVCEHAVLACPDIFRSKDNKPVKTCVFCGAADKLTKEHVIPAWTKQLWTEETGAYERGHRTETGGTSQSWKGAMSEWKVKDVCAKCNSGWLSRLESEARPIILRLLEETALPRNLTSTEQETLARWAYKTALVVERMNLETATAPPEYFTDFLNTQMTPLAAVVVLAFTPGNPGSAIRHAFGTHPVDRKLPVGIVTIALKELCFHVWLTTDAEEDRSAPHGLIFDFMNFLPTTVIHPVTPWATWPPPPLDREQFESLATPHKGRAPWERRS